MPEALVIGIDPDAAALRERSAAAARKPERGGLAIAVFLVASAEALPPALLDLADELRVTLPWGALLRGATGPEPWFADLVGRVVAHGGVARVVLSVVPSDHLPGLPLLDPPAARALAERYAAAGLPVRGLRSLTTDDVAGLGSTWAKRLGIPERRPAWSIEAGRG